MTFIERLLAPLNGEPVIAEDTRLLEVLSEAEDMQHRLDEALRSVDAYMDEEGMFRVSAGGWQRSHLTRDDVRKIAERARFGYMTSPLLKRGVNLRTYYTWGQGVEVRARDDRVNDLIQAFLDDEDNAEELFAQQARLDTDVSLHNEGNVFAALITDPSNGRVRVRTIPPDEVTDIVRDPEDSRRTWYYRRQHGKRTVLHPDIAYRPANRPDSIERATVLWDQPVAHRRTGGHKYMAWGVPETFAALDWVRAQSAFLSDFASLVRSLSQFAWQLRTPRPGQAKQKLGTTIGTGSGRGETNPTTAPGGIFAGASGTDLTPIPKAGMTPEATDNRELRIMVAAALELPDTLLSGDADVGNHATAQTLDRPTELMITARQKAWADWERSIYRHVIREAVRAPRGPLTGTLVRDGDRELVDPTGVDTTIDITFPSVLEHDVEADIKAWIDAATLDGRPMAGTIPREVLARELLVRLGVEDVDEIVGDMAPEVEESLGRAVTSLREMIESLGER